MNWRDKLSEVVLGLTRHCYPGGTLDRGEWSESKDYIEDYVEGLLKRAFQAGHREGAISALEVLPENLKDVYEFEPDVDKHWAEKRWLTFKKDKLEEMEV